MAALTHLDTHVAAWVAAGEQHRLSVPAAEAIEHDRLEVSPMVGLELASLVETGRSTLDPAAVLGELRRSLDLRESAEPFAAVAEAARALIWTRDPFDRLIAAQAIAAGAGLVTKDETIRQHLPSAIW